MNVEDDDPNLSGSDHIRPGEQRTAACYRDLTWTFSPQLPSHPEMTSRSREHISVERDGFYIREWTFFEHTGTHVDAPSHLVEGGRGASELMPEELVVPAVVVDISAKVAVHSDASVTVEDLVTFEDRYGQITTRAVVLMYSGWEHRASTWNEYIGLDSQGSCSFPGFSPEAARWLVEHRDVSGVGVDTSSLDTGSNTYRRARKPGGPPMVGDFPAHRAILGADRYGIENVRNHGTLPPTGIELFVGLVPLEYGSGAPCRLLARY